ncbi:MAG: hypothetical protein DRP26_00600 [Candidatus Zixiibacteriota bacterium]|nr:MAG: hypothetical protein DRP26_00600 [candidate division Zixibacteria bacterium]
MKILIANKYLYPRGGDCLYTLRLMKLLTDAGHTVIPFSMHHPQNIKTDYDRYFVPYIDFREELKRFDIKSAIKVVSRSIYNAKAVELMQQVIEDHHPDIIHLNNIHHQLTPAILKWPAKYNIPVVWTLHDYILSCPDNTFLRNGKICDKCAHGNNLYAIVHRCKKGSLGASLIAVVECSFYYPKRLAKTVYKFISPSRFLADTLTKNSLPDEKVANIPNFIPPLQLPSTGDDYFLYFGRLSGEKGVDTLLEAFAKLGKGKLIIAGDGPDRQKLENKSIELNLTNASFVGYQTPESIFNLLSGCLASIVPSICWENFPYSVMEAMAAGKPVIASTTGGIPEQIEHEKNGLLFEPGNAEQLAQCMARLYHDRKLAKELGQAGHDKTITEYSPETHYQRIMKIYSEAVDKMKDSSSERRVQGHIHTA